MRSLLAYVLIISAFLVGCSNTTEPVVDKKEATKEEVVEKSSEQEPSEQVAVEPIKTALTREDVNSLFKEDPDETQYEDGQLEFNTGEVVVVDYISYLGLDGIDYVSALFFEDTLVKVQLDTKLSDKELEKFLGIEINDNVQVNDKRDRGVYELTFNEKFSETAISKYPFEY